MLCIRRFTTTVHTENSAMRVVYATTFRNFSVDKRTPKEKTPCLSTIATSIQSSSSTLSLRGTRKSTTTSAKTTSASTQASSSRDKEMRTANLRSTPASSRAGVQLTALQASTLIREMSVSTMRRKASCASTQLRTSARTTCRRKKHA